MAVRKQCNRYKTDPFGSEFCDVLQRAKAFYKYGTFIICEMGGVFSASRPSLGFKNPENARYFEKIGRKWIER